MTDTIDWDARRAEHEKEVIRTIGIHDYAWTGRSPDTCSATCGSSVWCGLPEGSCVHQKPPPNPTQCDQYFVDGAWRVWCEIDLAGPCQGCPEEPSRAT